MKILQIKTILVPIDFSKLTEPALARARDLARWFDATIHLVHVHEFYYPTGPLAPVPISITTCLEDSTARRQRRLRLIATRNGVAATNCHFLTGSPVFHQVCNLARKIAADLIVMPTHGYTGVTRLLGGSTAERIVQHATCPVLVARANATAGPAGRQSEINSIFVPVDFSNSALEALRYATDLARKVAARLVLFHAVDMGDSLTADGYAMYDLSAVETLLREQAQAEMQKFVRRVRLHGVSFETIVRIGSPVSAICALAEERKVDLIITATHGRTGFKHLLMGSVAEQVVRRAGCPVLVVPSHLEIRRSRLTTMARQAPPASRSPRLPKRNGSLAKRGRKLATHSFPERRKTNRFREAHGAGKVTS